MRVWLSTTLVGCQLNVCVTVLKYRNLARIATFRVSTSTIIAMASLLFLPTPGHMQQSTNSCRPQDYRLSG